MKGKSPLTGRLAQSKKEKIIWTAKEGIHLPRKEREVERCATALRRGIVREVVANMMFDFGCK
jgi:hypothetical protein